MVGLPRDPPLKKTEQKPKQALDNTCNATHNTHTEQTAIESDATCRRFTMISIRQIGRLLSQQSYRQLADRILANGRCHCDALRAALLEPPRVRPVALGLALQRSCELAYGRDAQVDDLAAALLATQRPDALFDVHGDCAGTATALAGLLIWRSFREQSGCPIDDGDYAAIERGLDALARALQHETDAMHRRSERSTILSAVLWQLGHWGDFRRRVSVRQLLHAAEPPRRAATANAPWHYAAARAA